MDVVFVSVPYPSERGSCHMGSVMCFSKYLKSPTTCLSHLAEHKCISGVFSVCIVSKAENLLLVTGPKFSVSVKITHDRSGLEQALPLILGS